MTAIITLTGNLGKDPIERVTPQGTKVVEFSVANYLGHEKEPNWYQCTAFGNIADYCLAKLKKGLKVQVVGKLVVNETFLNLTLIHWPEVFSKVEQVDEEIPF